MSGSDQRLAEIEARLTAATPGPWKANGDGTIDGNNYAEVICRGQVSCMSYCYGGTSVIEGDNLQPDTEFIANAPEDVRFLLAEVAYQRARAAYFKYAPETENDPEGVRALADEVLRLARLTTGV